MRGVAIGLAAATAMTLSGCSLLDQASGVDPTDEPTPQVSPSVWVSKGKPSAVAAATARLIRLNDVGSEYKAASLTLGNSTNGISPAACAAVTGPALGVVRKATGRASTSFTSKDGRTAIAHTVAVYSSATSASDVLDRAVSLGKKCKKMTAFGQKLTMQASRTTVGGQPAVVLTQRQKTGAESISVIASGEFVSVVAIAALLPGPDRMIEQRTSTAAVARLTGNGVP
jgi:hypothetical protein